MKQAQIVIVMGVSGSGKSTVGKALADELGWAFFDADDFHPASNVEKMARGDALSDQDRQPWLESLHDLIKTQLESNQSVILACSALKQSYRDALRGKLANVRFLYLDGSFELIKRRLGGRSGHFMKADLLRSQFEALEEPTDAVWVGIDRDVAEIVRAGITALDLQPH